MEKAKEQGKWREKRAKKKRKTEIKGGREKESGRGTFIHSYLFIRRSAESEGCVTKRLKGGGGGVISKLKGLIDFEWDGPIGHFFH